MKYDGSTFTSTSFGERFVRATFAITEKVRYEIFQVHVDRCPEARVELPMIRKWEG